MAGYVNVLCLSDGDKKIALDRLASKGSAEASGAYVFGLADDEDVRALEKAGLTVEVLPPEQSFSWLEPDATPPEAAALAATSDCASLESMKKLAEAATDRYLIQFKGPLQPQWRAALLNAQVAVGRWVIGNAVKAQLTLQQWQAVEAMPFVAKVARYTSQNTLRRLCSPKTGRRREHRSERVPLDTATQAAQTALESFDLGTQAELFMFDLKCHDRDTVGDVAQVLKGDPRVKRLEQGRTRMRMWLESADSPQTRELLAQIADLPQVSVIEPYEFPRPHNSVARATLGLDLAAGTPPLPWDGTGQIVAVADTGVDDEHPDLKNRIIQVIPRVPLAVKRDPHGHGTHVCGSICGDGSASGGSVLGVAPGAKLIVQALMDGVDPRYAGLPLDLGDLFKEAYDIGARIHNNSWGVNAEGLFTMDADEVDEFMYEYPDCLIVISAGNSGRQEDPAISGDPLGRMLLMTLNSPGTSKNALVVGACCSARKDGPYKGKKWAEYDGKLPPPKFKPIADDPICGDVDVVAAFSSRGPTDAQQLKPDLLAPGTAILSTRSAPSNPTYPAADHNGHYCFQSGTSMAAPMAAGAAAVVRQYFIDQRAHPNPSSALLKATLINGAVWSSRDVVQDPETGMPNYHQGFGRLNLAGSIPFPGRKDGSLAFADIPKSSAMALNKFKPGREQWRRILSVQQGLPLSITLTWIDRPGHGLQQNLDLLVIAPGGQRLFGNPGMKRPSFSKGDRTNNVEWVRIENPEEGDYVVHVLAYNTPYEDQSFSIVATGKLALPDFH